MIPREAKKALDPRYPLHDVMIPIRHVLQILWRTYRLAAPGAAEEERERIVLHNACLEEILRKLDTYLYVQRRDGKVPDDREPKKRGRPPKERKKPVVGKHPRFVAGYYWRKKETCK